MARILKTHKRRTLLTKGHISSRHGVGSGNGGFRHFEEQQQWDQSHHELFAEQAMKNESCRAAQSEVALLLP
jgi:hypothetical protein